MPEPHDLSATTPASLRVPGAVLLRDGVHFGVYAGQATSVQVVIFDAGGRSVVASQQLHAQGDGFWSGTVANAVVGTIYAFRADGPYDPKNGFRYQKNKCLLDPYARQITGSFVWSDAHLDTGPEGVDNAAFTVKAVVVDTDDFDWQSDKPLATPMSETILYEVHVKGFSQLQPDVEPALRGTYRALSAPASIAHFKRLGVTALNLLPVHYHIDESRLVQAGQVNYWGYNTLGFFAADPRYAVSDARTEFREMVRGLHAAGIEVILDVVYNHTAEGNEHGPTLSWRGLDNPGYYRLPDGHADSYENFSGCGNTINMSSAVTRMMVLDSLRYWVTDMHVDGFRFDLAAILGRTDHGFDRDAPFFREIAADPVLSRVKLIAEPWDIGPNGYRFGQFPAQWSEWNDQFRQRVRRYWVHHGSRADLASSLAGSSETFEASGRSAQASVNYICAHDGFTLLDLLSYNDKHNLANGEENRDGSSDNHNWNCGHEGPTNDTSVLSRRARIRRSLLATLFLARGVPMLMAGDEAGRTQLGNNNAYCQDNATTWFDWAQSDQETIEFTRAMMTLRQRFEQLQSTHWLTGENGRGLPDVQWLEPDGGVIDPAHWHTAANNGFAMWLNGPDTLLALFNGGDADQTFALPDGQWQLILDTSLARSFSFDAAQSTCNGALLVRSRSVIVLQSNAAGDGTRNDIAPAGADMPEIE